jgi:hypothetical protein
VVSPNLFLHDSQKMLSLRRMCDRGFAEFGHGVSSCSVRPTV